jgi:hypothetical protein
MSNLQIMILCDQLHEPIQRALALFFSESIDVLHMMTYAKHGLPAGDGVGANHGVNGSEARARILWGAARGGVQVELVLGSCTVELRLCVRCSQRFEELLIGSGEAVVEFVARCP